MAKTPKPPNLVLLYLHVKNLSRRLLEGDYADTSEEACALFEPLLAAVQEQGGALFHVEKDHMVFAFGGRGFDERTPLRAVTAGQACLEAVAASSFKALGPAAYVDACRVNVTHMAADLSNLARLAPGVADTLRLAARLPRAAKPLLAQAAAGILPPQARTELYRGGKNRLYTVKAMPRKLLASSRPRPLKGLDAAMALDLQLGPRRDKEPGAVSALELRLQRKGGKESGAARKAWNALLSDLPRLLEDFAARYGGSVLKRSKTQAVLAFTGHTPVSEAPLRAIRVSLDLCTRLEELSGGEGAAGRISCTVATRCAPFGRLRKPRSQDQKTAVKAAASLRSETLPGYTLVDEVTAGLVDGAYHLLPPGKSGARLLTDRHPIPLLAAEVDPEPGTTMVGRHAEMGLLRKAVNQVREAGKGMVFTLVGEPGMGKTRLALEAMRLAQEKGVRAYYGSCPSDRVHAPFLPIKDILSTLLGLHEFGETWAELEKLEQWLVRFLPVQADTLHKAFRVLFHLPGKANPVDAYVPRLKLGILTKSILSLIEAEAARSPLFLIFDNLHRAFTDTLDLIARIEELSLRHPVVVMKTTVPSVRIPVGPGEVRSTLRKLSQSHSLRLGRHRLGARTLASDLEKAVEKLKGVPGDICELLDELRWTGRLADQKGRWDFARKKDRTPKLAPRKTRRKRIDGLSKNDRKHLGLAAFLGRRFSVKAFRALSGAADPSAVLEGLARKGFLCLHAERGARTWTFPDPRMHEAAMESVEKGRARRLHHKAAEALLEAHGERLFEHIDRLVYHFREAGQGKRLGEFLIQGAIHAKSAAMAGLAEEYFSEAMNLFEQEPVYDAWLRFELAGLLCQIGSTDKALDHLRLALGKLGKPSEIPDFDERFDEQADLEEEEIDGEEEEDEDSGDAGSGL